VWQENWFRLDESFFRFYSFMRVVWVKKWWAETAFFFRKEIPMFCPKCGKENSEQAVLCDACGFDLCGVLDPQKAAMNQPPKTCGLAGWSLRLGIASIFLSFLTSIAAIICGHLALGRIKRSQGRLSGSGMAIAGLVMGYIFTVCFGLQIAFLLPALGGAKEMAGRSVCASNLRQIGLACQRYAQDNHNLFPDKLSRLYPKYLSSQVFRCPDDKPGATPDLSSPQAIDKNTSYLFFPGLKSTDRPDTPLAGEKKQNHNQEGGNVLYIDGHVSWMKSK
jgi:prepilin-type processing-associated H-X9-DG protein